MELDKTDTFLMEPAGKLPAEDKKLFETIVTKLIDTWKITRPPEIMLANRMAATFMKMRRVEYLMTKYDLFFEKKNDDGSLRGIEVNGLAYYLKALEADFRNYYKVLQGNRGISEDKGPQNFIDLLKTVKDVKIDDSGPK